MSTLAVIPARLASTRLRNKPLQLLAGRPLVLRVWERVQALEVADQVVVATDSQQIADVVSDGGGTAILTSTNHPSGTDRVAEVAALAAFSQATAVLNVQGDEPFVSRAALLGALEQVRSGRFVLGTVAVRATAEVLERPEVVKVVAADDGRAMYFSRAAIPWLREREDAGERDMRILQHLGIYAYTPEALARWVALPEHPLERIERLEQLRPLAAGMAMGVARIDEPSAPGIDTSEDLELANARWAAARETSETSDHNKAGRI